MKVKEVQGGQIVREVVFSTIHSQILMSNNGQMLFSGTKDGKVISHGLPLGADRFIVHCHQGNITSMAIAHDDSMLFTVGEDGVLCVFSIRDKDNRTRDPERAFFSQEVQTTRAEIEERANQLRQAESERAVLDSSFKVKKEHIESQHKSKEGKVREKARKEKDRSRILSENRKKEKDEAEMNNNAREKQLTREWEDRIAAQEDENGKRIYQAQNICVTLQNEKARIEAEWRGRADAQRLKHAQLVAQLQGTHRKRLQDAQQALQEAQEKKRKRIQQIEEMKQQILTERETAIHQCEKRLGEIHQEDERTRTNLQDEHGNKKKECTSLQKQYEQQQLDRSKLSDQQDALQAQLNELSKEIARLNEDIKQKDATIVERGMKIEVVKKENQELEKYHQVLNHQENLLHNQMDPLDRQIERETRDISAMDHRLETAHKRTAEQNELIASMQHVLQSVIENERRQTANLNVAHAYFEQAKYDLHDVVSHFHAKDELKALFLSFYAKYMKGETTEDIQLDEDVEAEHQRQKTTLETQVRELREQQLRDDQFQRRDQSLVLLENAALIEELQALRTKNRQLVSSATFTKKTVLDTSLLPATEAQRRIQENRAKILQMEQQLLAYQSTFD
jgi:hypothetical protein